MTNELEKKFFNTFEITTYKIHKTEYPQITDHKLLKLIVIIMRHEDLCGYPQNIKDLKEDVLKQLIGTYTKFSYSYYEFQQTAQQIKEQVQLVFKETK